MGFSSNTTDRVDRDDHRIDIKDYNILIDGRNFYDEPINDELRKYDELRNIKIGGGEDYRTGFLLDYDYYKKH